MFFEATTAIRFSDGCGEISVPDESGENRRSILAFNAGFALPRDEKSRLVAVIAQLCCCLPDIYSKCFVNTGLPPVSCVTKYTFLLQPFNW